MQKKNRVRNYRFYGDRNKEIDTECKRANKKEWMTEECTIFWFFFSKTHKTKCTEN